VKQENIYVLKQKTRRHSTRLTNGRMQTFLRFLCRRRKKRRRNEQANVHNMFFVLNRIFTFLDLVLFIVAENSLFPLPSVPTWMKNEREKCKHYISSGKGSSRRKKNRNAIIHSTFSYCNNNPYSYWRKLFKSENSGKKAKLQKYLYRCTPLSLFLKHVYFMLY